MFRLLGGSSNSAALAPVHIPTPIASVLFNTVPIVVLFYGFWDEHSDYLKSQSLQSYQGNVEEFDFIIGAGSAGSVLANRLTENGNYNVLLLEAGGNPNPMQSVPAYFTTILHTPQVDYDFYTVPQKNACLALKNQRSFWPRGKGLGGSSNLNAMLFQRGNKHDYDRWAELSGDDTWKFDSIIRNFKNIEDYHGNYFDDKWHSNDGKGVYVSPSNEKQLVPEFLEAAREMGYPTKDVNGFQEASFCPLDLTIKNGHRHNAYAAFLEPILNRKNLHIYRYARVSKVHFNKYNRATGVTYKRHGVERFVKAKKEIILSAGAIDSPKLLMLSGIGPRRHLTKLGIHPFVDLPVGQNLQDHILTNVGPFIVNSPNKTYNVPRDLTIETITNYIKSGTGLMSTPLLNNAVGYIYSSLAFNQMRSDKQNAVSPDIQLLLVPIYAPLFETIEKAGSIKKGFLKSYWRGIGNKDNFHIVVMLGKPKSRGEMRLASANPMDKPILNPRYFSHPDDIKMMTDGINFTVAMVETTRVFQEMGAHLMNKHLNGCEKYQLKSMEYYECYARHWTLTVYHQSGTCTMGKGENDPMAVVDSKLRVLKTKGLRVADSSIIPEIPNSNLNAAVYMIADKASEIILDYWKGR